MGKEVRNMQKLATESESRNGEAPARPLCAGASVDVPRAEFNVRASRADRCGFAGGAGQVAGLK